MYEYWYYYEMDSLDLTETRENEEHCDWDTWGGKPQNDAILTSDTESASLANSATQQSNSVSL